MSVRAQLPCPLGVFGEAKEGVRQAGCRSCNQQRWEWAQHSPRELEEGDGVARVAGEEFIYKPAGGSAITSLFACVWCDSWLPQGAPYAAKFTVHSL